MLSTSDATTTVAGTTYNLTLEAETPSNTIDPNFAGTVSFTSSDGQAVLPANYTFTSTDAGSHTFSITLKTAGSQTITASEVGSSSVTVTTPSITVTPAAASTFSLVLSSTTATAGTPLGATLTARDAYGNIATGYTGTVQLTSTDGAAILSPAKYTFNATTDAGAHTFSVTFETSGTETVTAADTNNSTLTTTSANVVVSPATPTNLTATASSTSQINLSWTAAAGASGYEIQRSTNATTGFTQIGTTAAGVTTYQDTGLKAGTEYYYRVLATGAGATSSYSNTADATTQGTAPPVAASGGSIWGTSYTPQENAYSWGSFEVGVKFTASTSGTVSGVSFYKESWMGGYTHVGHLWSSTGTLLATAAFTNETPTGWQTVSFATPVSITANTTYIVSFSTGGGYFGISTNYFSRSGVTNGALSVPIDGGVYGNANQFPSTNGEGMNFWADVVYTPNTSTPTTQVSHASSTSTVVAANTKTNATTTTGTPSGTQSTSATTFVYGSTPPRPSVAQAAVKKTGGINFG